MSNRYGKYASVTQFLLLLYILFDQFVFLLFHILNYFVLICILIVYVYN